MSHTCKCQPVYVGSMPTGLWNWNPDCDQHLEPGDPSDSVRAAAAAVRRLLPEGSTSADEVAALWDRYVEVEPPSYFREAVERLYWQRATLDTWETSVYTVAGHSHHLDPLELWWLVCGVVQSYLDQAAHWAANDPVDE